MNLFLMSIAQAVYSIQLANGLGQEDNVLIALHKAEGQTLKVDFPDLFHRPGFNYVLTPHYRFPDPRLLGVGMSTYCQVDKHRTDLIHIQTGRQYVENLVTIWLACRKNIPLVATVHDVVVHPGDRYPLRSLWIASHILHLADHIIVHGKFMVDQIVNLYGMDERKVSVVPHGNYDLYCHAAGAGSPMAPEAGRVLLFGRMFRYKGIEVLIEAAPLIEKRVPDLKIVLAGRGPEQDRLLPRIRKDSRFEIHNRFIKPSEIVRFFSRSSLIVLPYLEASQSGPLNLAFSFGRPVVASRVGAIPEILTDGIEGVLVQPGDPVALADAIVNVLTNRELATRMGIAGRKKATDSLDWAGSVCQQTRDVYRKAIEMRSRGINYRRLTRRELWKNIRKSAVQLQEYGRQGR